jgi:hypothetical protein
MDPNRFISGTYPVINFNTKPHIQMGVYCMLLMLPFQVCKHLRILKQTCI